jgi:regulator of protease activity HflC (stomatin/prohibitin superfamily)
MMSNFLRLFRLLGAVMTAPFRWIFGGIGRWFVNNSLPILFASLLIATSLVVLWKRVVYNIPSGSVAVVYRPFWDGLSMETVLPEGLNIVFPLNTVTIYDATVHTESVSMEVLTKDQLKSTVKVSFQYQINKITLPLLHKYVGPDYYTKIILPAVTGNIREIFAGFGSSEAFTQKLQLITNEIAITTDQVILEKLSPPGLDIVRMVRISFVQLESMNFPPEIEAAIRSKLVEAQVAESYVFKLQAARSEAERKEIEAGGVKKFQDIVNEGLSEQYLKLRGIEATLKLAESSNSKVVIFGSSPNGLPFILNDNSAPGAGSAQTPNMAGGAPGAGGPPGGGSPAGGPSDGPPGGGAPSGGPGGGPPGGGAPSGSPGGGPPGGGK